MSVPVIRSIGGNQRPFGHRAYIGFGSIRTTSDPRAVERREAELRRRDLWLNCERAPFNRAHP